MRSLLGVLQLGRQLGLEGAAVIVVTAVLAGLLELVTEYSRTSFASSDLLRDPGQPYRDLRRLLATVAGIVLGLYFTALATRAETIHAADRSLDY